MSKQIKEVEVIPEEELQSLPQEAQEVLVALNNELNAKDIVKFNPIIAEMLKIQEFTTIKYDPEKPETIDQYKEAIKFIGAFNQKTKNTKAELKKPYLEVGRKLDAIEKLFLNGAKNAKQTLVEEFKEFELEKARKRKEAEDRKNAELLEKQKELEEKMDQNELIIKRMQTKLKYDKFIEETMNKTLKQAETYSYVALLIEIDTLNKTSLDLLEEDIEILSEDVVEALTLRFNKMKETCISLLQNAIKEREHEVELTLKKPEEKEEEIIAPSLQQVNPDYFKNKMMEAFNAFIATVKVINPSNDKERKTKKSVIAGIENYQGKIKSWLELDETQN